MTDISQTLYKPHRKGLYKGDDGNAEGKRPPALSADSIESSGRLD